MSTEKKDRTIFWGSGSPYSRSALIALEGKGLEYTSTQIQLMKGEARTPEMLKLNPRGKVPVLVDGDMVVYESLAILLYLEEQYPTPSLMPTDLKQRAVVYQRLAEETTLAEKAKDVVMPVMKMGFKLPENDKQWEKAKEVLREELSLWEGYLGSGQYLVGDTLTLADVKVIPGVLLNARFGCKYAKFPNLRAYWERVKSLPQVAKTEPPHWKDNPPVSDVLSFLDS